jgi:uncharacterized membrane protein
VRVWATGESVGIGKARAADPQNLPPPIDPPWTNLGFAPWVQPMYMRLRSSALVRVAPELVLGIMIVSYIAVFGWLTWLQQANFGTFDYDMGIFDQEIWLAAHHLNAFITVRGLNMWANHVNPIVYLLVPFYWLGAGPHFLYIVQTLAFAISAVPLWLLARDRFGRPWLALGIPFAWLMYPSVEWMNWWHFHPESLGIPAFLFAYWFADRQRWGWYAACVVLVLACKEDAAFPIMALGVLLAFRHQRKAGLITLAGALSWFLICVEVIMPDANGALAPFYLYRFSALGNSVSQIIWNVFRHPTRILHLAVQPDRYRYYAQLFLPVAGMALLAPATLFLVVPTLLENVTNNQGYAHDIRYQYTSFVAAGIFLAVVEGINALRGNRVRVAVGVLCAVAVISNATWSPSPLDSHQYDSGVWTFVASPDVQAVAKLVRMVPASAGVSASYTVVPHLSHRDQIYTFPNPWVRSYYGVSDTQPPEYPAAIQYLVIDEGENSVDNEKLLKELTRPGGPFKIIAQRDRALLAKRVRSGD